MKMDFLNSDSVRRRLVPCLWVGSTALYLALGIFVTLVTLPWHRLNDNDLHFITMPIWLTLPLVISGYYARQAKSLDGLEKDQELRSRVAVAVAAVVFISYLALSIGMIALLGQVPQYTEPFHVSE